MSGTESDQMLTDYDGSVRSRRRDVAYERPFISTLYIQHERAGQAGSVVHIGIVATLFVADVEVEAATPLKSNLRYLS